MKHANKSILTFVDHCDFTMKDECVWVVYPPGAAGDLIASIINFHYSRTGCLNLGITDQGQVIFIPTDDRISDILYQKSKLKLDETFINIINSNLSNKNLNYSVIDQVIFSNHCYDDKIVYEILNTFPSSKIIRVIPKINFEKELMNQLSYYKNFNKTPIKITNIDVNEYTEQTFEVTHPRLLNIPFGSIFEKNSFDIMYSNVLDFLDLPCKLISSEIVEFWLSKQHKNLNDAFSFLKKYYKENNRA